MNCFKWRDSLLELFFPSKSICPICWQKDLEGKYQGVCPSCLKKIMEITREVETCPRCGYFTAGEACPNCRYWAESVLTVGSVVPYDGVFKELIHDFKYNEKKEFAFPLGYLMAYRVKEMGIAEKIHAVMPVPLYIGREIERGYNQSLLLAKVIAKELQKPLWRDALERKHFHHTQTILGRKERVENLAGAFEYARNEDVNGNSILLVDDIITTGATLLSCTNTLQKAGAQQVYGITWAAGYSLKLLKEMQENNFFHREGR